MAIEDSAALVTALQDARGQNDLARVLRVFEEVRSERTRQMQQASSLNGNLQHFADGPLQQARDAAMEAEVLGLHFETSSNQWSDPVTQQWAYGYDAVGVIQQRLSASRN
jgi:salicylate hydroxylase